MIQLFLTPFSPMEEKGGEKRGPGNDKCVFLHNDCNYEVVVEGRTVFPCKKIA